MIYVFGARGQLGRSLMQLGCEPVFELITDNFNSIKLKQHDVIINAAAKTDSNYCQLNPDEAFKSNAELAGILAKAARNANCSLFHISTDYVFKGDRGNYADFEGINPQQNVYALSKAAGEMYVKAYAIPGFSIIRTAWVFSPYKKAWFDSQKIWNQTGSLTYALDLAQFLIKLADVPKSQRPAIIHYSTVSPVNRTTIAQMSGNTTFEVVQVPADKPKDSSLLQSQICSIHKPMPLGVCLHEYRKAFPVSR